MMSSAVHPEVRAISKVIIDRSFSSLVSVGVDDKWFPAFKPVWKWLLDFHAQFGGVPSLTTFKEKWGGDIQLVKVSDPWDYVIHELRIFNMVEAESRVLAQFREAAMDGSSTEVAERNARFQVELAEIALTYQLTRDYSLREFEDRFLDTSEQIDYYTKHSKAQVFETGVVDIDEGASLARGRVVTIAARGGVGKTYNAMYLANNVRVNNGVHIGFVGLEMGHREIQRRLDAIEAARRGVRISNRGITLGGKSGSPMSKLEYKRFLESAYSDDAHGDFLISTNENSVGAYTSATVESKVYEWKQRYGDRLGVVVLDYVTLLDDASDWIEIARVTRRMKSIAQRYNICIVLLAQAQRGDKYEKVDQENIGLGPSFAHDSDIIFTINLKRGTGRVNTSGLNPFEIWCVKNRHGEWNWRVEMGADLDYGVFKILKESGIDHSASTMSEDDDGSGSLVGIFAQ